MGSGKDGYSFLWFIFTSPINRVGFYFFATWENFGKLGDGLEHPQASPSHLGKKTHKLEEVLVSVAPLPNGTKLAIADPFPFRMPYLHVTLLQADMADRAKSARQAPVPKK